MGEDEEMVVEGTEDEEMAAEGTEDKMDMVSESFNGMDVDKDDSVTKQEIIALTASDGDTQTLDFIEKHFPVADKDKNDKLTLSEFSTFHGLISASFDEAEAEDGQSQL